MTDLFWLKMKLAIRCRVLNMPTQQKCNSASLHATLPINPRNGMSPQPPAQSCRLNWCFSMFVLLFKASHCITQLSDLVSFSSGIDWKWYKFLHSVEKIPYSIRNVLEYSGARTGHLWSTWLKSLKGKAGYCKPH